MPETSSLPALQKGALGNRVEADSFSSLEKAHCPHQPRVDCFRLWVSTPSTLTLLLPFFPLGFVTQAGRGSEICFHRCYLHILIHLQKKGHCCVHQSLVSVKMPFRIPVWSPWAASGRGTPCIKPQLAGTTVSLVVL